MDVPSGRVCVAGMDTGKVGFLARAEVLMREVDRILPRVRRRAPNAADHLERSTESVLFNTAEGAGAFKPKVKIAAYEIAKKEASEARAVLRRLVIGGFISEGTVQITV
jgi:four helix bundle protein